MLNQANHWLEIAGAGFDALLLARVLMLRLHRVYVFITLACLLAVFFDAVGLWLGDNSPSSLRFFLYSRFLYAFLYPLAAWDVFEELQPQAARLRRMALPRLISSLFMAAVFGLIASAFIENNDAAAESPFVAVLAFVLWAGACTATLGFLWTLHRQMRAQQIVLPHNTFVWMIFFQLTLLGELIGCIAFITQSLTNTMAENITNLTLLLFGIAITVWCIVKLRSVTQDMPSAREKASL